MLQAAPTARFGKLGAMGHQVTSIDSLLVTKPAFRQGRPCLRGTGITVHQVAVAHMTGLRAEEICAQNPDLDPSLFYAALAYYFANKAQIEADIQRDDEFGAALAAKYPNGIGPDTPRDEALLE
jgi:uncharacterized protein (DUF433 family)